MAARFFYSTKFLPMYQYQHQYQFEKNARRNRQIALFLTIAFHVLLLAAVLYGNQSYLQDKLPDPVREWLGMENVHAETPVADMPKP